jgi:BirA family biotin operon repressor/biotin-[acetyl-CoA-carboxylase] ligase
MPFHFDQIPSTQTFLKELVITDPKTPHLEYALADSQTDGVGRMGRSWVSDPGNLYLSVWIRNFDLPLTWVPHWVGVSLLASLRELGVSSPKLSLKWPNDLIFEKNKKVAGILCEKVGDGIIAGIGANLLSAPELGERATTSIATIAPELKIVKLNLKLAEKLLEALMHEPKLHELETRYQSVSLLKPGSTLQWLDLQTGVEGFGTFLRYGAFGELIARCANTEERSLYSEEIRLVL